MWYTSLPFFSGQKITAFYGSVSENKEKGISPVDFSEVEEIVFDNGIEICNSDDFQNMPRLKSFILPESVWIVKQLSLNGCTALENIRFPNCLKRFNLAMERCTSMRQLILPEKVDYENDPD